MRIVVLAEGKTERATRDHLKGFFDTRAGNRRRVGLDIKPFDGALTEAGVRGRAEEYLRDSQTLGVVALTDLHPQFQTATQARRTILQWVPKEHRARVHVHVAKHDFEAWLLIGWDGILALAGIKHKQRWGAHPEDINRQSPPAHRLRRLFREGTRGKEYSKVIDGKKLFEQLDPAEVARHCPEFKSFINCLLRLARYTLLD